MAIENSLYGESRVTRVSWGAVFSGFFVFLGVAFLFTLLGSAIGLTAFNPQSGDTLGSGAAIGVAVYLFVTILISFFVAGYAASRLSRTAERKPVSILHSVSVWGMVLALFAYVVGSGIGGLVSGLSNVVGGTIQAAAGIASTQTQQAGTAGSETSAVLKRNLRQKARGERSDVVDRDTVDTVLADQLHISKADADKLLDQAGNQANKAQGNVSTQLRQAGGKVVKAGATGSWYAFFLFLFGGLATIFGGLAGTRPLDDESRPQAVRPSINRNVA